MQRVALPGVFLLCLLLALPHMGWSGSDWSRVSGEAPAADGLCWVPVSDGGFAYGGFSQNPDYLGLRRFQVQSDSTTWGTVATSGGSPTGRSAAACAIDETESTMYVFGGENNNNQRKDFYKLAVDSSTWGEISSEGPEALTESVGFVRKNSFFLMGGFRDDGDTSEVWQYNIGLQQWKLVPIGQTAPPERFSHAGTYVAPSSNARRASAANMPSHGELRRQDKTFPIERAALTEPLSMTTTAAEFVAKPAVSSAAGFFGTLSMAASTTDAIVDDAFYVVAGRQLEGDSAFRMLSDVWRLTFQEDSNGWVTGEWTQIKVAGFPVYRAYHTVSHYNGSIWVAGGFLAINHGQQTAYYVFNDLLKLVPHDNAAWQIAVTSSVPTVRYHHAMIILSNGMLYITSGRFNSWRTDTWAINLPEVEFRQATEADLYVTVVSDPFISSAIFIISVIALFTVCICVFIISMRQVVIRRRRRRMRAELDGIMIVSQEHRGAAVSIIDSLPIIAFTPKVKREIPTAMVPGTVPTDEEKGTDTAQEKDDGKETCAVCLVDYELKEEVKVLPCAHVFHVSCIDTWLRGHKTCPLCKHNVEEPPPDPARLEALLKQSRANGSVKSTA